MPPVCATGHCSRGPGLDSGGGRGAGSDLGAQAFHALIEVGGDPGGVEGPAAFASHSADEWYLFVDVIPEIGYRPLVTDDLDAGWRPLQAEDYHLSPHTKHGGVIGLTRADYERVREALL